MTAIVFMIASFAIIDAWFASETFDVVHPDGPCTRIDIQLDTCSLIRQPHLPAEDLSKLWTDEIIANRSPFIINAKGYSSIDTVVKTMVILKLKSFYLSRIYILSASFGLNWIGDVPVHVVDYLGVWRLFCRHCCLVLLILFCWVFWLIIIFLFLLLIFVWIVLLLIRSLIDFRGLILSFWGVFILVIISKALCFIVLRSIRSLISHGAFILGIWSILFDTSIFLVVGIITQFFNLYFFSAILASICTLWWLSSQISIVCYCLILLNWLISKVVSCFVILCFSCTILASISTF